MIAIKRNNLPSLARSHYDRIMVKGPRPRAKLLPACLTTLQNSYAVGSYQYDFVSVLIAEVQMYQNDLESSIITCSPTMLQSKYRFYSVNHSLATQDQDFLKAIAHCFYYSKYEKWGAYTLADSLKVNVCPYCNRAYTFTIGNDLSKGTRPHFDHYINKATAPYLSLSFFNLIPSCYVCNSGFKKDQMLDVANYTHPYLDDNADEVIFSLGAKSIGFVNGVAEAYSLNLVPSQLTKLSAGQLKRITDTHQVFRLSELYEKHKDYVDELIQKAISFTPSRINAVYKEFKGTLFKNPEDAKKMLLGNYHQLEDLEKRPLAKLTRDISAELERLSIASP
jgi:hypothetical protein